MVERQDERVIETAGALKHRSAAGDSPQDGDLILIADIQGGVARDLAGISKDGKVNG